MTESTKEGSESQAKLENELSLIIMLLHDAEESIGNHKSFILIIKRMDSREDTFVFSCDNSGHDGNKLIALEVNHECTLIEIMYIDDESESSVRERLTIKDLNSVALSLS